MLSILLLQRFTTRSASVNGEKTVLRAASFGIKMQIRERKTAKNSQNLLFISVIFSWARNGHNRSGSSRTHWREDTRETWSFRTLKTCQHRYWVIDWVRPSYTERLLTKNKIELSGGSQNREWSSPARAEVKTNNQRGESSSVSSAGTDCRGIWWDLVTDHWADDVHSASGTPGHWP